MTAMLNTPQPATPAEEHKIYPERLSFRITQADHYLYDALESSVNEDDLASTGHIVLALLRRWEANPEFQQQILHEARTLASERRSSANVARSKTISKTWEAKTERKRRSQQQLDP